MFDLNRGSFRIFRVFGIDIYLHISWFMALGLVTFISKNHFDSFLENVYAAWLLAFTSVIFLYGSVVTHELAHALTARRLGYRVKRILLFLLGGVSVIEERDDSPGKIFASVAAGPLSSFILAGLLYVATFLALLQTTDSFYIFSASILLDYLVLVNIVLGTFNLIPAFPLDGGRLLVSALRLFGTRRLQAVGIVAWVGRVFCVLLIATGTAGILFVESTVGNISGSIMLIFVGILFIIFARAEYKYWKSIEG